MQLAELLVSALAAEERTVRAQIPFAIHVLESLHLFRAGRVPVRLLVDNASAVYDSASTEHELHVLQRSLWVLYEHYAVEQTNILPPPQYLPVRQSPPFWSCDNPPLSLCEQVIDAAQQGVSHHDESVRLPAMLLLLARSASVIQFATLKTLLLSDSITVLKNSGRAVFQNDKHLIFLDAMGLLLLRRLQTSSSLKKFLRNPANFFEKWAYSNSLMEYRGNWRALLTAAVFLDSPMYSQTLSPLSKQLPLPLVLLALAGVRPINAIQPAPLKKRSKTIIEHADNQNEILSKIAFNSVDYDLGALAQLNFILTKFENDEPKGLRNSSAFNEARFSLQTLESYCRKSCSSIVYLIVFYCKNLFLTGSAWKENLAASTVKNYASALKIFARDAWSDNALIEAAQSSETKQFVLTEQVIEAFENITAPDRQNTVSNFCKFLVQRSRLKFFDTALLDYLGAAASSTRLHYIPLQLFDTAMTEFLASSAAPEKQQIYWFMQLCYYLGLRYTEAAHLHFDDITPEWIYVSRRERRKSHCAVRRVSTAFMPECVCESFLQWVDSKRAGGDYLFDEYVLDFSLTQALQVVRDLSGIADFVVHSLRHCAANNMLWIISILVNQRLDWRQRYYFCRSPLFDNHNLSRIRHLFESLGREVSPIIPVMEFVASQLGHSSPAITASSYWHLLYLLSWEQSHLRTQTPDRRLVLQLLPENNYRYAVWPKNAQYDEMKLFSHVCRGWNSVQDIGYQEDAPDKKTVSTRLNFSEFIRLLVEYCTLPCPSIDERLQRYFYQHCRDYDASLIKSVINQPAFLRLLERINQIVWTEPNKNSVLATARIISNTTITDIRSLKRVLRTLNLLGYQGNNLIIRCTLVEDVPQSWLDALDAFKFSVNFKEGGKKLELELPFIRKKSKKSLMFLNVLMLLVHFLKYHQE
ncbi:hypothetical protein QWY20_17395 [Alkalimonas sp. MEB108]|uniref:Tyr recombinase domain-containing protein n=1 Tax=Alkalimonas cellulosilytica TaxID=3058395 RepID=A0ABU7J9L1_9GAMM|nr:hypothetical protein [Alkalimonas sp. MEB108]MEE2003233.1 hypothetical protein [Alkalimonas sp. MEB108]